MVGETTLTIVGNLVADPELRFTPAGTAMATFTVAATPRTPDRESGQWRDGAPLFLRCSLWRDQAEHATETLSKGARVIVVGRLRQRSFDGHDGERRTTVELDVDELGPSLRYATAVLTKTTRSSGGTGDTTPDEHPPVTTTGVGESSS